MRQAIPELLLLATVAVDIPVQAQNFVERAPKRCEVWGHVVTSGRFSTDGMEIELSGPSQVPRQRTPIVNGAFDFEAVPRGTYQIRIFDRSHRVILRRSQVLKGANDPIYLRFPYLDSEYVTSVAGLGHKTPRQAMDAYRSGMKAADAGEFDKSIGYFEKAIAIDPQFIDAEHNLSVEYGNLGRFDKAVQHSQRAYEISPESAEHGHTLALFLVATRQYERAERLARTMLAKKQAVPEMDTLLAQCLFAQQRNFEEAFEHIEHAAADYPIGRLLVAAALAEVRRFDLATAQVDKYLKSAASECERVALEDWESALQRPRSAGGDGSQ